MDDDAEANFMKVKRYLEFVDEHFYSLVEVEKEVLKKAGVIVDPTVRQPAIPLAKAELMKLGRLLKPVLPAR